MTDFEKPKKTIAAKFSAYISILIFITIIFMTFYAVWSGINLIDKNKKDKVDLLNYFSTSIVEANVENIVNGSYDSFDKNLKLLTQKDKELILFVCVINSSGIVKYSTLKRLEEKSINDKQFKNIIESLEPSTKETENIFTKLKDNLTFKQLNNPFYRNAVQLPDKNLVLMYFFVGTNSQINMIYRGYLVLALTFIICGFISAVTLAKMVTKPIHELYIGAESFAQKDLAFRIDVKTDDEIGKLAESFNKMAEELENSYRSLEQKVADRTKELAHKNEEIEKAYKDLQVAQVKLVHSEKMSSLGQLVAGIAHELNNPINFIYGNMEHLKNYANDLKDLLDKYASFETSLKEQQLAEITELKEDIEYEFLLEDLDDLINSCKEGAERTRQIVLDLRNFSRLDEATLKEVNIHEGMDSTLNILHNKYKNRITVVKDYGENLPLISCFAGQLNQVFMNLLANAAQSIDGVGTVKIATRLDGDYIKITINDTGCGISPDNLSKIFDPFFTTKDVGEGTGLGLSVSYGIIEKHNGTISVESKLGEGTTFTVKIPTKWKKQNDSLEIDTTEEETSVIIDNNL